MREPVLVINDDPLHLKFLRGLFASEGYTVRTAQDAEEAFELMQFFRPVIAIVKLDLPDIDGCQLIRHLKASPLRDMVVIAIAPFAMDRERAEQAGVDGCISEPFDPDAIIHIVSRQLRREHSLSFSRLTPMTN